MFELRVTYDGCPTGGDRYVLAATAAGPCDVACGRKVGATGMSTGREDMSVSRRHCVFSVSSEAASGTRHALRLKVTDHSRLGIKVNDRDVPSGGSCDVADGDVVSFASVAIAVRVLPVVVCCSSMKTSEKTRLAQVLQPLGGTVVDDWSSACRFLVMKELFVTTKLLRALIAAAPVVVPRWFDEVLERVSAGSGMIAGEQALPLYEDFVPPLQSRQLSQLRQPAIDYGPDKRRSRLLSKWVLVVTGDDAAAQRLDGVVTGAGGLLLRTLPTTVRELGGRSLVGFLVAAGAPLRLPALPPGLPPLRPVKENQINNAILRVSTMGIGVTSTARLLEPPPGDGADDDGDDDIDELEAKVTERPRRRLSELLPLSPPAKRGVDAGRGALAPRSEDPAAVVSSPSPLLIAPKDDDAGAAVAAKRARLEAKPARATEPVPAVAEPVAVRARAAERAVPAAAERAVPAAAERPVPAAAAERAVQAAAAAAAPAAAEPSAGAAAAAATAPAAREPFAPLSFGAPPPRPFQPGGVNKSGSNAGLHRGWKMAPTVVKPLIVARSDDAPATAAGGPGRRNFKAFKRKPRSKAGAT